MPAAVAARTIAISRGESRYYTGVPCVNGHVCERRVVGNACVECQKAAVARQRERMGSAAFRAASVAANARMRERMGEEAWSAKERARCLKWAQDNREKHRATARASMARLYKRDPKRFAARSAAFEKQMLANDPMRVRLSQAARRAAYSVRKAGTKSERGLTAIVRRVWEASGGKCAVCGCTDRLELDHIVAIANGGGNDERNLQFLCKPDNVSKGKRDYETWLQGRPLAMAA